MPHFSLSDDLLHQILFLLETDLRALFRARRVCHSWNRVSTLVLSKLRSLDGILKLCGNNLKHLDLRDPEPEPRVIRINETSFTIIGRYCKNLEKLDLSGLYLINDHLLALASDVNCLKLQWLNMTLSFSHSCPIYSGLDSLYKVLKSIKYLNLSYSCSLRIRDMQIIWPPTLHQLYINHSTSVSSFALTRLTQLCPQLEVLSINTKVSTLNDGLQEIFLNLLELRVLSLQSYDGPEDLGILIGQLHNLKELYLADSSFVTDSVLKAIGFGCPVLEVLDCSLASLGTDKLTNEGLHALALYSANLKQLNLNNRQLISDSGPISMIGNNCLESLSLSNCPNIGSATITALGHNCSNLFSLEIDDLTEEISTDVLLKLCNRWFQTSSTYVLEISCRQLLIDYDVFHSCFSEAKSPGRNKFVCMAPRKTVVLENDLIQSWFWSPY